MSRVKNIPSDSHGSALQFRLSRFSSAYRSRLLAGLRDLQNYCEDQWGLSLKQLLSQPKKADKLLGRYVMHRHEEQCKGSLSIVKHALLGCQHTLPKLRSRLNTAWANLKVWEEQRVGHLRPPLPVAVWLFMVGLARAHSIDSKEVSLKSEWSQVALLLEVGLLCLLRPGELFRLTAADMSLPGCFSLSQSQGAIRIKAPKNRRQFGEQQHVPLNNPSTLARLQDWIKGKAPEAPLWEGKPARFSKLFKQLSSELGLESCRFTPGSLRPGGATLLFGQSTPINVLRFLGRWTAEESLEHYIQQAMATQILNQLSVKTTTRLCKLGPHLLSFVLHPDCRIEQCRKLKIPSDAGVLTEWCIGYAMSKR